MYQLYALFSSFERVRIFTMMLTTLLGIGGMSWVWGNAKQTNIPLTSFGWAQIYVFGLISFLSAVLVLGMLIVPDNAEALLELIHAEGIVSWLTLQVQSFLLYLVRSFM